MYSFILDDRNIFQMFPLFCFRYFDSVVLVLWYGESMLMWYQSDYLRNQSLMQNYLIINYFIPLINDDKGYLQCSLMGYIRFFLFYYGIKTTSRFHFGPFNIGYYYGFFYYKSTNWTRMLNLGLKSRPRHRQWLSAISVFCSINLN